MAKIIDLPKLSPTMEEGTLVRWAKNEGDKVDVDDLLAEVETDKATMEFRAFDRGTLLKKLVPEGATAKLGQPVAIFGEPGEDVAELVAKAQGGGGGAGNGGAAATTAPKGDAPPERAQDAPRAAKADAVEGDEAGAKAAKPAADEGQRAERAKADARAVGAPAAQPAPRREPGAPAPSLVAPTPGLAGLVLLPTRAPSSAAGGGGGGAPAGEGGRASPRVRRIARERGVDLARVRASGAEGRITADDVERAASAPPPAAARGAAPSAAQRPEDTVKPASQMRKTIARRLTEAKRDVPHFYLEADMDVEALSALREQLNEGVEKEQRITVNDLLIRACALALREVPASNASWIDGNIVQHHRVDVSVAVAVEDGLVTPVVRDADAKSLRVISTEVRDLAARARAKKLKLEEMQGGVFSISNLGMFGIDRFSAVINPPEGMILAVGATRDVPVVRGGQVVPGKRCAMTLSCDHRVVDGALGAQFLKALRGLVERPVRILV